MIGIVVAAHGVLANALVTTARSVFPESGLIEAVGITDSDDAASYEARLQAAVERVQGGDGVLVLTDMFGGTPSNVGLTLHRQGHVEVLTGANLPMLIKAMQLSSRGAALQTAAVDVKEYGLRAIAVASEVLGVDESAGDSERG
jgi:PTS system mannose-specific IIA component